MRSLGTPQDNEATLIQSFYRVIEKYTPQLVSWNGGGFDLPVLHYRALVHGIPAGIRGEDDRDFKWNNYISRYHSRHTARDPARCRSRCIRASERQRRSGGSPQLLKPTRLYFQA